MLVVWVGERLERRVSWMPGADGAPLERALGVELLRFVVEVGWVEEGAMRRDCRVKGSVR